MKSWNGDKSFHFGLDQTETFHPASRLILSLHMAAAAAAALHLRAAWSTSQAMETSLAGQYWRGFEILFQNSYSQITQSRQ